MVLGRVVPVRRLSPRHVAPKLDADHLYRRIARRIENQVSKEIYRTGDRVPSVRHLSAQLKTSVGTVIEAYRLLENDRLLEAHPQSGYYVPLLQPRTEYRPWILIR